MSTTTLNSATTPKVPLSQDKSTGVTLPGVTLPLGPGATLGVLGGGQLGRMFAVEALRMGYRVVVLDPDPNSPAGLIATQHIQAPFDDATALAEMSAVCDAITIEFENIPAASVRTLSESTRVTPSAACIEVAQDREIEKDFAARAGLKTAPYGVIRHEDDIEEACEVTGFPCILKTSRLGYDGKGQVVCQQIADVKAAFASVGAVPCVLEQRINLAMEISVVLCRSDDGTTTPFPVAENQHVNGILDISIAPAAADDALQQLAIESAVKLSHALNYVGVMAVEFFISAEGELLVNEMAPRPHNSGHFTLDATASSQFEQQVRMLCGLPAASCDLLSPVVMLNLLGDRWAGGEPAWSLLYQKPQARLHLYAKASARAGRKMGHVNFLDHSRESVIQLAQDVSNQLSPL